MSEDREPPSLPNLGVLTKNGEVQPAVTKHSIFPFLTITLNYLLKLGDTKATRAILDQSAPYLQDLAKYDWNLERSWYTRPELFFLSKVVQAAKFLQLNNDEIIWKVAMKLVSALPADRPEEVKAALEYTFSHEKFQESLISERMENLEIKGTSDSTLHQDFCKRYEAFLTPNGRWSRAAMPQDWLYLPIVNVYSRTMDATQANKRFPVDEANARALLHLESNVPQLVAQLTPNLRSVDKSWKNAKCNIFHVIFFIDSVGCVFFSCASIFTTTNRCRSFSPKSFQTS